MASPRATDVFSDPSKAGGVERWALLIGIDYYLDGTYRDVKINPLTGCVRDVRAVEKYLETIGVPQAHIIKLLASEGENGIKEEESDWPTSTNIKAKLDEIRRRAKPGALVLVHYSGHGILRNKIDKKSLFDKVDVPDEEPYEEDDDGGNNFSGAALVPVDVKRGGAYLSAYQLGAKIKSMVEQEELRVTLVLDCCYSGRGIRGDDESDVEEDDSEGEEAADWDGEMPYEAPLTRGIEEGDDSWLSSDEAAENEAADEAGQNRGMETDILGWLEDPKSCVVLTACGVQQTAKEDRFTPGKKDRNGVLTHWVLHSLQQFPKSQPPSHKTVQDHTLAKIANWRPKQHQTPGIFGEMYYEFFGPSFLSWTPSCRVFKENGDYFLEIGRAQGVTEGGTYELRREEWQLRNSHRSNLKSPDNAKPPEMRPIVLRVSKAFDLRAKVELTRAQDADKLRRLVHAEYPPRAVRRQWALPSPTLIRVVKGPSAEIEVSVLEGLCRALEEELSTTHNMIVVAESTSSQSAIATDGFLIAIDASHIAQIQDGEGRWLPWLPTISLHASGAAKRLADLVRHVARFKAIMSMEYGRPKMENRLATEDFELTVADKDKKPLPKDESGAFIARDNQWVQVDLVFTPGLEITAARAPQPVYGVIFQLSDQFGIIRQNPPRGQPPLELCRGDENHPYVSGNMTIPEGRKQNPTAVIDTYRAYVYKGDRQPSWDELELGEVLAEPDAEDSGNDDGSDRGMDVDKVYPEDGQWAMLELKIITRP